MKHLFSYIIGLVLFFGYSLPASVHAGGSISIQRGQPFTLSWSVTDGGNDCVAETNYDKANMAGDNVQNIWSGTKPSSGSASFSSGARVVSPAGQPYIFSCTHRANGAYDEVQLTVTNCAGATPNWNGTQCTASPTADMNSATCVIADGASSCPIDIEWSTTNALAPVRAYVNGTLGAEGATGNLPGYNVHYGTYNVELRDGNNTLLTSAVYVAKCSNTSVWNGSSCIAESSITGTINSQSCTIPVGQGTCNITATYTTTNAFPEIQTTAAYADNTILTSSPTHFSFTTTLPISPGTYPIDLRHKGTLTTLGEIFKYGTPRGTYSATCANGTYYNTEQSLCLNPPSGSINGGSCTIGVGSSTCSLSVIWNTSNAVNLVEVMYNGTPVTSGDSANFAFDFPYGSWPVSLTHQGGQGLDSSTLGNATFSATCGAGTLWNGTICASTACTLPWGGTLANGGSVTAYQNSSVTSPATCVSQTRTCTNGTLSGTYTNQSCAVVTGPQSDLMSTTVLPKEATVGMAVSLSGTIANNGLASTGASFPYFFQIATAPNGGGTLSNLPSSTMNTLAVGASGVGTASHTFSSVGVYSVRICADQTTQGSGGVITESNEGNNCGAWTTFFVLRSPQNLSATCNSSTGMITISGDNYTTALSNSEVSAVHYPIRIHDTSTTWVDPTPCNGPFGGGNYCSDSNPSFPTTFQGVIGKSYFIWAHTKATFTNGRAEYWAQDTPSSTTVTCSATPQPDLVVTSLTGDGGAQATVGVSKRFLVGVSNTGTATTGSGFNTFVQINTQPDGSGAMYDGSYSNSGALTSGQSTTVDPTYTFSSAGTYYVRACTDAQNSSFVGNVAESNEGNNCGAWTAFTVTSNSCTAPWGATVANGASVTAYQTSSVVAPATCVSQTLTCTNGTLSGTYTNQTCVTTPSSSPDLTAGSVSPTSATAGASTALSATISNIGTASTGANFPYFFQVATAANGGGTVTSLSYVSAPISSLAAGATLQGTSNYTFSSAGTYSARLCVDMANGSLGYGAGAYWANITESNENNNCGAWTTITVTANTSCTAPWGATVANGASVTAYQTSSVTSPASCVSQTRTCTNGTLSGTYANQTCVVLMDTCPSGTTQDVVVTGATSGGIVYGTDIYTEDSSVNMAAVHAGILSVGQTATIRKNFGGNMSSYTGSTRNGVTSVSYGSQWCSMTLTNIGGGADVIAGSVTPVTATSDQSVTFSANVTNSGTLTTGISFPYFFQVATDAFGTGAVDLSSNTTSALVSGATRAVTRSYTFNLPSGGTRYVRMCADKTDRNDTTGSLVETNENNNCGAWTMVTVAPTPPANLTASTVTPTSLTTGTRNLSTTVSNIGLGDTQESIPVLIQVATSSNGGGTITNLSALAGWIDAGNATTFSRSYTFTTAGTYSARACADMTSFGSGGVETESNELDNCSAWTDIVVSPPPQPNLVSGVVTPSSAQAGNSTTFSVTISNTGNASTGASFSYFFQVASGADGSGTVTDLTSSTMSSISSGNSRTGTRAYTFASSGTYSMRACADKTNATNAGTITESNESDNCGTWTNITVLGAGCSAQTVTWGTSCTASIGAVADGAVISINDSTIPNTGSATYSCTNGTLTIQGGSSCVTPPAVTLISSPQTVTSGDTTTLTWTVSGSATACTIDNAIGSVSTTGGSVTTPQLSTTITHTLTCTNAGGSGTASYTTNVTPMPNLIAGSVSPVAVIAGDATTLSATISNTGTANTGASFPYFFQVASGADGSGIIINLAYSNMSTLSTSASAVASANHTFTSGGTLSVRVCADKQTPTHAGVITESNENDNCGVWTNVTVVAPSGDLTVSSNECLIQTGENSCQVTATWVTQNASSPILKNEYTGGTLSNALQMTTPFSLTVYADQSAPNDNTFSLKQGILDLDQETVTARCAFGGYDSISDTCVNPQIVSVTVHGEYYAVTGRLQVTCSNSDTYRVVLNGVTHQSGAYNGTTVNVPVNTTGDYSVYCGKGDYYTNPPRVVRYNASPPPSPDIVITATPSTLSRESDSMISWRIIHPRPGCTLTAKTVCQNNTCNSNQITHENTINQRIQTALVDSASANMLVSNVATMTDKPYIRNSFFFNTTSWANRANWEEEDWSVSAKAKFESFLYTTNFTLNCPSVQNSDGTFTEERERTVRVMVTSSGEQ